MKTNTILITLLSLIAFLSFSCGKKEAPAEKAEAILKVINDNQAAINSTNTSKLRATSTGMDRAWEAHAAFKAMEANYYHSSIKESKIIKYSDKKAIVEVMIYQKATTADASDQTYKSTRTVSNVDGKWLVSKLQDEDPVIVTE